MERFIGRNPAKVLDRSIRKHNVPLPSIGSCQRIVHGVVENFNLRKLKYPSYRDDTFGWLSSLSSGVWFVRLPTRNAVDNFVVVDG